MVSLAFLSVFPAALLKTLSTVEDQLMQKQVTKVGKEVQHHGQQPRSL